LEICPGATPGKAVHPKKEIMLTPLTHEFHALGPDVVERLRELSRTRKSPISRIPGNAFDSSDGGATHRFNGQLGDAVKNAKGTLKSIVRRAHASRECPTASQAATAPSLAVLNRKKSMPSYPC
jgi:hypothetical protein